MVTVTRPNGSFTPSNPITNTTKYQDDSAAVAPKVAISSAKLDGDINKAFDVLTVHDNTLEAVNTSLATLNAAVDVVEAQVISVKTYGAKMDARRVTDGVSTSGSNVYTSATAAFTSADIGKLLIFIGAGAASGTGDGYINMPLIGTITAITPTTATVNLLGGGAANASFNTTGREVIIASDDLVPLNAAIAAAKVTTNFGGATVLIPTGDLYVSAVPTNTGGVQFTGSGRGLIADRYGPTLFTLRNDDYENVFGQEYLGFIHRKIRDLAAFKIVFSGDSTTAGAQIADPLYWPDALVLSGLRDRGIIGATAVNRGQSGQTCNSWANAVSGVGGSPFVAGDIAAAPDCVVVRWGINDPINLAVAGAGQTITQYETNLRVGLAALRAHKTSNQMSIILMTPNPVSDSSHLRDEKWLEQVSLICRKAARDYECAFIDTFRIFRGAARGKIAEYIMDAPYADAERHIHPLTELNGMICDRIVSLMTLQTFAHKKTNNFLNYSSAEPQFDFTDAPSTYPIGVHMQPATTGNGWPFGGMLKTERGLSGHVVQTLYCATGNASPRNLGYFQRQNLLTTGWTEWTPYNVTETNFALTLRGLTVAGSHTYSLNDCHGFRNGGVGHLWFTVKVATLDATMSGTLVLRGVPTVLSQRPSSPGPTVPNHFIPLASGGMNLTGGYTDVVGFMFQGSADITLYKSGANVTRTLLTTADLTSASEISGYMANRQNI
jgi:hypothetical protein